jgi:hypothetical protein
MGMLSILNRLWRCRSPESRFPRMVAAFHKCFPNGGVSWCDFRPTFDGYLFNLWCAILPIGDCVTTRQQALIVIADIADWLRQNHSLFDPSDRIQIIVGFAESVKPTGRQIFKCWLDADRIPSLKGIEFSAIDGGTQERPDWHDGIDWSIAT